ncbi:hypothetical protein ACHAQH_002758 [Verticillium albo-atrum]
MSLLRVFDIRLKETPKYMLASGQEEQLVSDLQDLASKYNKQSSLRYEHLLACGTVTGGREGRSFVGAVGEVGSHLRELFATRRIGLSTGLVWFSWTLIDVCINIYYGTLYAYTAEVLPSAHRTKGNGIAVGCNRIMGLLSAIIAQVGDTTTTTPLYIYAAMFIIMAVVSAALPFEPRGTRAS